MDRAIRFYSIPYIRFATVLLLGAILTYLVIASVCLEHKFNVAISSGVRIQSDRGAIVVEDIDLIKEPGEIVNYTDYNKFFVRQAELAHIIAAKTITVTDKETTTEYIAQKKTVFDLPTAFWIQVIVALGGIFISGWIWALKPKNAAAFFFFLSGIAMGISAFSAAVYTTRVIAIPSPIFKFLAQMNAWGATIFGLAMFGLFFVYPRVVRNWKSILAAETAFFGLWTVAYVQQWHPMFANFNLTIAVMMLFVCVTIGVQFVITKKDPKSRAILSWLGLSVLLGAGFFVVSNSLPLVLGKPPLEQAYAFLSFLVIYLGIALGLKQYRLFEVGNWAYRFFFYTFGAALFVLLEAFLIFYTEMDRFPALGLALLAVGIFYLPLRDFLWRFFNRRRELPAHELLSEALHVTLAPSSTIRLQRWEDLVKKTFDPLEMSYCVSPSKEVTIYSDGVTLIFPMIADMPAMRIAYPWSGRTLFNRQAIDTAEQIVSFIRTAETSRKAYDRGVNEERLRIAQDLHDDVSSRLLTGLHSETSDLRSTIQGAMTDIRSIIKGITGEKMVFGDVLADLRSECQKRVNTVGMTLEWPLPVEDYSQNIDYHIHKTLGSVVREIVSNVIKHSKAKKIEINVGILDNKIYLKAKDDGLGFPEKVLQGETGFGLKGLNKRITDLGGTFEFTNTPHAAVTIVLPAMN